VPEPGRRSVPHLTTHWSRRQQRRDRALESDERANLEAEEKRLEQAIDRLLDHMEAGEDVEKRLKQRRAELDALRVRLAEPEGFDLDEARFEKNLADNAEWLRWRGPVIKADDAGMISGNRVSRGAPQAPRARKRPGAAGALLDLASRVRGLEGPGTRSLPG
jgi:hypothetical protein